MQHTPSRQSTTKACNASIVAGNLLETTLGILYDDDPNKQARLLNTTYTLAAKCARAMSAAFTPPKQPKVLPRKPYKYVDLPRALQQRSPTDTAALLARRAHQDVLKIVDDPLTIKPMRIYLTLTLAALNIAALIPADTDDAPDANPPLTD